jgi:hypothetical protein
MDPTKLPAVDRLDEQLHSDRTENFGESIEARTVAESAKPQSGKARDYHINYLAFRKVQYTLNYLNTISS